MNKSKRIIPFCSGTLFSSVNLICRTLFPQRDCMTLVRPVTNEDQLQNMSKLSPEELRPEFRAQIEHLKSFVFRKAPMKMFRGACVTGSSYAGFFHCFLSFLRFS